MSNRHLTPNGRGLGWRPQLTDHRDLNFLYAPPPGLVIPANVDLRHLCPPVYDQGPIGSCTANAIAGAIQFDRMKQKLVHAERIPSRLMVYYDERAIEGTVNSDAGAEIRDGIKSVARQGACFEDGADGWPYVVAQFKAEPPAICYAAGLKDRALVYQPIGQTIQQMRRCLAAGYPFVFGFTCYPALDSDEVANTGKLPMPGPNEAPIGGHAVMAVGYDDPSRYMIVRNSWGPWALDGYFLMPYEYIQRPDLASDFWRISTVSA